MNKQSLAKKLSQRTMLNQKEANNLIEELFDLILEEVSNGEEVAIVGVGKFYPYQHKPRPVRNPKTQKEMVLEPYISLRFKPSNVVKDLLKKQDK